MICPKCGTENTDAMFCGTCGAMLSPNAAKAATVPAPATTAVPAMATATVPAAPATATKTKIKMPQISFPDFYKDTLLVAIGLLAFSVLSIFVVDFGGLSQSLQYDISSIFNGYFNIFMITNYIPDFINIAIDAVPCVILIAAIFMRSRHITDYVYLFLMTRAFSFATDGFNLTGLIPFSEFEDEALLKYEFMNILMVGYSLFAFFAVLIPFIAPLKKLPFAKYLAFGSCGLAYLLYYAANIFTVYTSPVKTRLAFCAAIECGTIVFAVLFLLMTDKKPLTFASKYRPFGLRTKSPFFLAIPVALGCLLGFANTLIFLVIFRFIEIDYQWENIIYSVDSIIHALIILAVILYFYIFYFIATYKKPKQGAPQKAAPEAEEAKEAEVPLLYSTEQKAKDSKLNTIIAFALCGVVLVFGFGAVMAANSHIMSQITGRDYLSGYDYYNIVNLAKGRKHLWSKAEKCLCEELDLGDTEIKSITTVKDKNTLFSYRPNYTVEFENGESYTFESDGDYTDNNDDYDWDWEW